MEITLDDKFILRNREYFHLFVCPTPDCEYNSNRRDAWDQHVKRCTNEIEVTYKQKLMNEASIREWCIRNEYLPADYYQKHFACFDIETLGGSCNKQITESTLLHNVQKVVTISVTKSFGDDANRTQVFIRKSFSKSDYESLIRDFMSHLEALQLEMANLIPRQVQKSIVQLECAVEEFKQGKRNYSPQQITTIRRALVYMNKLQQLKVYGYNSSGFDIPVLFQGNYSIR